MLVLKDPKKGRYLIFKLIVSLKYLTYQKIKKVLKCVFGNFRGCFVLKHFFKISCSS